MPTEFQFLADLQNKYALRRIGDDCAVLPKDGHTDLVVTADLLVEEIDFRLDWARPEDVGHKALAVSLSDVAAMGAKPVWAMLSLGVPEKIWNSDFVDRFYAGWFALADRFGVELVGGDVSRTPDKIVVDSVAAGEAKKGEAVLRAGAQPGDLVFVTGALGGAAGGLKLLFDGSRLGGPAKSAENRTQNLILKQLRPSPETDIGRQLGAERLATSMIDLSDGLSGDLRHLCRSSRVGARIFADRIPADPDLDGLSCSDGQRLDLALHGGEDFRLLLTVDPKIFFERRNFFEKHNFSEIGEVTANAEMIELISEDRTSVLEPKSFLHF